MCGLRPSDDVTVTPHNYTAAGAPSDAPRVEHTPRSRRPRALSACLLFSSHLLLLLPLPPCDPLATPFRAPPSPWVPGTCTSSGSASTRADPTKESRSIICSILSPDGGWENERRGQGIIKAHPSTGDIAPDDSSYNEEIGVSSPCGKRVPTQTKSTPNKTDKRRGF